MMLIYTTLIVCLSFVTEMSDFTLTLFNVSDEMAGSYMCNISVYSINDCRLVISFCVLNVLLRSIYCFHEIICSI